MVENRIQLVPSVLVRSFLVPAGALRNHDKRSRRKEDPSRGSNMTSRPWSETR